MKKETVLLIDVSNSFTKFATARNGIIGRVTRMPTTEITPKSFSTAKGKTDRVVISSVVPKIDNILSRSLTCPALWVDHRVQSGIRINYPKPSSIGADRLANAAAAVAGKKLPAIIVDFGTAVTFDVIDNDGYYLGGIIAPGLPTAASALHERTALLPMTNIRGISSSVGKSTEEAIQIGLLIGAVGLVREAVTRIRKELFHGKKPILIATGGDAALVGKLALQDGGKAVFDRVDPLLTLRGLLVIAEKNP